MMNKVSKFLVSAFLSLFIATAGQSALVYVTSSDDPDQDAAVVSALTSVGHQAVIGVTFTDFDGTVNISGYDSVFLQANYNWTYPDMPAAGQTQIVDFVNNGGGLVTAEWILWMVAGHAKFQILRPILSSVETTSYNSESLSSLVQVTPDPIINSNLPAAFDIPGDNFAGTETNIAAVKAGATVFYNSVRLGAFLGLTGWDVGQGRVAQFSQTVGKNFLADPRGSRLVGNVLEWVSHGAAAALIKPATVSIKLGKLGSGTVTQLGDIDGQNYQVCRFFIPNQQASPITVEVEGNSPIANPESLVFRTYSKMTIAGAFSITLDMFDWNANAFSTTAVSTSAINQVIKIASVTADNPQARFVNGSGRVKARYRIKQTGPGAGSAWCNDMDQAIWFVR